MAIDFDSARPASLRDRKTGKEREVYVFPHTNGQAEVWTAPKRIFIDKWCPVKKKEITIPVNIPARRLHWIAEVQCIWSPTRMRYEVRL